MSISENGPQGHHRGRIGNIVYYTLNGKNVSRGIGISTKPPTEAQLSARMVTSLTGKLTNQLLDFIRVGFSAEAIKAMDNPYNQALRYNKKNIIKGIYPNLEVAYDQLVLSKGPLKQAENWEVTQITGGLQFKWDTDLRMAWPEATDQVMMLAYLPKQKKVVYVLFGNSRLSGNDVLEIPPSLQDQYMETYMSFVTADRKQVAISTYTGAFNRANPGATNQIVPDVVNLIA